MRDAPADDTKAVVDLWSYKDDYIQPMQKVRAERDRNRTFTAAYLIPERKIVQLGRYRAGDRDAFGERAMGDGVGRSRIPCDCRLRRTLCRRIPDRCGHRRAHAARQEAARQHDVVAFGPLSSIFRRQGLEYRFRARRQENESDGESRREVLQRGYRHAEHARPVGQRRLDQGRQEPAALRPLRHLAGVAGRHGREEHHRGLRPRARYAAALHTHRGGESARAMDRWDQAGHAAGRESQDVRDGILPRVAGWRRARSNSCCRRNI